MLGGGGVGNTLESSFSAGQMMKGIDLWKPHNPPRSPPLVSGSDFEWLERKQRAREAENLRKYQESDDFKTFENKRKAENLRKYQESIEPPREVRAYQRGMWSAEYEKPPLLYDDPPGATAPSETFLALHNEVFSK